MRRSIRDAIVGFSILGGVVAFTSSIFWLRGIRLNSNSWNITANFEDASGLAERTPVRYRGILIGSVSKIKINDDEIKAIIEINNPRLRLPKPVVAKVFTSSLLGGDVQLGLISKGEKLKENAPLPLSKDCLDSLVLCNNDEISGEPITSISTLTEEFEKLLKKAGKEDVVSNLVESTKQFDITQRKLEELVSQVQEEILRAEPIITNLTKASQHISNILASVDNQQTLDDIKETASYTRSITNKIDNFSTEVEGIMNDDELMSALRKVTIGLGEFFNEVYPSKIDR